jgi:phospholipase/carboxylesterase
MYPQEITLGSLEALQAGDLSSPHVVIMLHGFGADNSDLVSLSRINPQLRWIFPNGPEIIRFAPGMEGRAWYHLDIEAFQHAMATGHMPPTPLVDPEAVLKAGNSLQSLMHALYAQGADPSRIAMGGFSQGAGMATHLTLLQEANCAGLIFLSGLYMADDTWSRCASKRAHQKYLQTHGHCDPLLPYALACKTHDLFTAAHWEGVMHTFNGGHDIPRSVEVQIKSFLQEIYG